MSTAINLPLTSTAIPNCSDNLSIHHSTGGNLDSEAQQSKEETEVSSNAQSISEGEPFEDNSNVPKLSIPRLFWFFLSNFGLFAWGGSAAQIALLKQKLVIQDKWISITRFQRVFSVYSVLPGPEAAELCMFFGCLSGGRLGGLAAGIGFITPGFVLMLLASYLYSLAGFTNVYFNASFRALQPAVAAMVSGPLIILRQNCANKI